MALPKVGNNAPAFSLENQDGESISLKDFKGEKNVLIYFYPKAMTPGCTTQACGLRDIKSKLSRQQTVVLGISPDPVKKLKKFQEKEKLNFNLLSDDGHKLAEKYGVWGLKKFMGREYMGVNRISFLVGIDGKLKHVMEKVKTKTHHEDVLALVKALNKK